MEQKKIKWAYIVAFYILGIALVVKFVHQIAMFGLFAPLAVMIVLGIGFFVLLYFAYRDGLFKD